MKTTKVFCLQLTFLKSVLLKINVKMNKKLNVESKYIKMGDDVLNYELCNFDLKVDLKFK